MTVEPLTQPKDERTSGRQIAWFIVSLPIAAAFVAWGLSLGLNFAPTTVESYTIVPDHVQPNQETTLKTKFIVSRPPMGSVGSFCVNSTWVSDDPPEVVGLPETCFSFDEKPFNGRYGEHENTSPVLRYAPKAPGIWRLETVLTTKGVQMLRRVESVSEPVVSNPVTVLPPIDETSEVRTGD